MLISCTSCKSQYLVNSADLKPDGRTVQCAKCGNQWYQNSSTEGNEKTEEEMIATVSSESFKKQNDNSKSLKSNLPSTYVKEQKVSLLNSILVVLFVIFFIITFWVIRNIEINSIVLIKFYFNEFIFNLRLIFNDIAKVIYKVLN